MILQNIQLIRLGWWRALCQCECLQSSSMQCSMWLWKCLYQQNEKWHRYVQTSLQATTVRTPGFLCARKSACLERQEVTAASVITAAFYADAEFLPVTEAETRSKLSQSPLSVHPHVPQDLACWPPVTSACQRFNSPSGKSGEFA